MVCSLVLCSIADPDDVLRQLFSMLRPGGELRYLEHVASAGMRADCSDWPTPRCGRGCWATATPTGDTEKSIAAAGFEVDGARREWVLPAWVPLPVSETAIGRAVRPATASSSQECGQALQQTPAAPPRRSRAARSWRHRTAASRSGLTSITGMPSASASSGSPAAG